VNNVSSIPPPNSTGEFANLAEFLAEEPTDEMSREELDKALAQEKSSSEERPIDS
jgi:hypothetical protein